MKDFRCWYITRQFENEYISIIFFIKNIHDTNTIFLFHNLVLLHQSFPVAKWVYLDLGTFVM